MRGPGRWQRLLLDELEDADDGVVVIRRLLGRPYSRSDEEGLRRAAHSLVEQGLAFYDEARINATGRLTLRRDPAPEPEANVGDVVRRNPEVWDAADPSASVGDVVLRKPEVSGDASERAPFNQSGCLLPSSRASSRAGNGTHVDPSADVLGDGPAGQREGVRGEAFGEAFVVERDEDGHLVRRFGPRSRVIYSEDPDDDAGKYGMAIRAGERRRRDDD